MNQIKRPSHRPRTVLVTGATGFIGSHMVRALVARGDDVVALVRSQRGYSTLEVSGARIVRGDLENVTDVLRAAQGCSLIHHIAAATSRLGIKARSEYTNANVVGTRNVMVAARENGVSHIVHCSSAGVYGRLRGRIADEDTPPRPDNAYRRSKLEAEEVVHECASLYGLNVAIVRPGIVYGPGSYNWLPFFRDIVSARLRMIGDGGHPYDMIYVSDVVDGLIACEDPKAAGRTYNLVAEKTPTLADALEAMAAALDAPYASRRLPRGPFVLLGSLMKGVSRVTGRDFPLSSRIDLFVEPREYSSRRINDELGFSCNVSLSQGMKLTADWLYSEGLLGS